MGGFMSILTDPWKSPIEEDFSKKRDPKKDPRNAIRWGHF